MVTGDHAVTARSIGRAVGLVDHAADVVDGKAIAKVIEAGPAALRKIGIFARVSPAEKLALVKAYQAAGDIVAMTGDGVNDAPALRQADIGVAMGLRGTDVAREAAAMILLDDAFPTIVKAIRAGPHHLRQYPPFRRLSPVVQSQRGDGGRHRGGIGASAPAAAACRSSISTSSPTCSLPSR